MYSEWIIKINLKKCVSENLAKRKTKIYGDKKKLYVMSDKLGYDRYENVFLLNLLFYYI